MKKSFPEKTLLILLSILMLMYGGYLIFIYFSGKVQLLIHPDYAFLTLISGVTLLALGVAGLAAVTTQKKFSSERINRGTKGELLIIIITIIGALLIQPAPLSTSTAMVRKSGLNDDAGISRRVEPVARFIMNSKKRRLIEWVNLFNQDPDPSQYEGQKAKVSGFVLKDEDLPQDYFMIARFILSCCAADARPIGIPVRFDPSAQTFENDQWIELTGEFFTSELDGETIPAIELTNYKNIPVPENPYANL